MVLSYSTRGFGTSGGLIDTAGPLDMADLSNVIDYLIANFDVDPNAIGTAAKTGKIGDGKVFISAIESAIRIRTDEKGDEAL